MDSPIMSAVFFSLIKGMGFKNHSAAHFMDEGLVVWEKIIPSRSMIRNLNEINAPSMIPFIET